MVWRIPIAPRVRLLVVQHPYRWLESALVVNAKTWERRFVVLTVLVGIERIRNLPKPGLYVVKSQFLARDPAAVTRIKDRVL